MNERTNGGSRLIINSTHYVFGHIRQYLCKFIEISWLYVISNIVYCIKLEC